MTTAAPYVAVTFSSQPSVAYFLRGVLECAGLTVAGATFTTHDLEATVRRRRPDVIVCDVSFPFRESWTIVSELRARDVVRDIPIVITTSEAKQLFRTVGVSADLELFARPDDVSAVRAAVFHAIESAVADDGPRSTPSDDGADFPLAMNQ